MRILSCSMFILFLSMTACQSKDSTSTKTETLTCKGVYYERINGELKKFVQYEKDGQCLTDNLSLSRFEKTLESWNKNSVTCKPQPSFPSRTLVAANNYYSYRDGKAYLDFDSSTGIFRRIVLAENDQGEPVYARLQGCYYQRTGTGVDVGFGKQLLLDTDVDKIVTSQDFDPMEIFQYTEAANEVNMLRFDDTKDYDYRNCPYLRTPWEYCTKLRDGNEMYFPTLPMPDQIALTNEAIVMSRQYNWVTSNKSTFDSLWDITTRKEAIREDYLYEIIHIPDTPRYIDQAYRDYLLGTRPTMPDVNSNTAVNICYEGSKTVTLDDGSSGKIKGQICYVSGQYVFTQY